MGSNDVVANPLYRVCAPSFCILCGGGFSTYNEMAQKLGINPFQSSPALAAALKTSFVQNSKQSMGAMREVPKVKNRQLNPRDPKDLAVMQSLGMKIVV